jgi:hypothetical protein
MERCVESPALEPPSETREAPETAAAPRQGLVLQKGDAHTTGYYVSSSSWAGSRELAAPRGHFLS